MRFDFHLFRGMRQRLFDIIHLQTNFKPLKSRIKFISTIMLLPSALPCVVARARDLWVGCVAPEAVSMRDERVGDAKTNELTCRWNHFPSNFFSPTHSLPKLFYITTLSHPPEKVEIEALQRQVYFRSQRMCFY
jgi:hypothetical protein